MLIFSGISTYFKGKKCKQERRKIINLYLVGVITLNKLYETKGHFQKNIEENLYSFFFCKEDANI